MTETSDSSVVVHEMNVTDTGVMASVMVLPFTNYTVTVVASTSAGQGAGASTIAVSSEAG